MHARAPIMASADRARRWPGSHISLLPLLSRPSGRPRFPSCSFRHLLLLLPREKPKQKLKEATHVAVMDLWIVLC